MRAALIVLTVCASTIRASEPAPGEFDAKSPHGRFTITQKWVRPDYFASDNDCNEADCGWAAVLHFVDKSKPQVSLADQPEWYSWPADYHISADEQWIIRDQKTGSGENALFLYHLTREGQIWRLTTPIDDAVFATLLTPLHRTRKDYYHLEVVLTSWDLAAACLHLKAYATPNDRKDQLIEGKKIRYDLNTHVPTPE
jgi:hypothetical protein